MARTRMKMMMIRRSMGRRPKPQYKWVRQAAISLTLNNGTPQWQHSLLTGASADTRLAESADWSRGAKLIVERMILTIAVAVTTAAVKKVMRLIWGTRIQELDAAGNLPASYPTLAFSVANDKREDWLYIDERDVVIGGDVNMVYGFQDPWKLDFKPRRALAANEALVIQPMITQVGGGSMDYTVGIDVLPQVLLSRRG